MEYVATRKYLDVVLTTTARPAFRLSQSSILVICAVDDRDGTRVGEEP